MTRLGLFALVATLAGAAPAFADDKAAAKAHFESAEAHFRSGEYREAINGYASSHKLFPAPILLFNIGLCHERLGEKPRAIEKYRAYLAAEPDGPRAGEARTRVETLTKLIEAEKAAAADKRRAAIAEKRAAIIQLRSEGKHDELAAELAALHQLEPDPELLFEIASARERAGQRSEAIAAYETYLSTEAPARGDEARRRRDALARPAEQTGPGSDIVKPGPVAAESPSLAPPIIATSAAIGGLAIGAIFGARSAGARDDLEELIEEGTPPLDDRDPRLDGGKRDALIANIAFGASLASAAVAGYLWYRFVGKTREAQQRNTRLTAGPGQVGLEVRW